MRRVSRVGGHGLELGPTAARPAARGSAVLDIVAPQTPPARADGAGGRRRRAVNYLPWRPRRTCPLRGSRGAEHVDLRQVALPGRQANEEPVELARPEAGSCSEAGGDTRPPRVLGRGARVEDVDVAFAADDVHPVAAGVVEQVVRVADARDGRDLLVRQRVEGQEARRLSHTDEQTMPTLV